MNTVLLASGLPFAVHIRDGFLLPAWQAGGFVLAGLLALLASYKVRDEEIPRIALLSAAFFVASLMHLSLGPASVHLLLNGLVGVVLGRRAPLAILVGIALQMLLFGHGGMYSLGVNACVQMLPALMAAGLFALLCRTLKVRPNNSTILGLIGFVIGAASVLGALLLEALVLIWGGETNWQRIVQLLFVAHLPVAAVEGVVLGFTVSFLARVKPEMLGLRIRAETAAPRADFPSRAPSPLREEKSPVSPLALLLAALTLLTAATPVRAHRLDAGYILLPDRQVRVESWFDLGGVPKGATVKVFRPGQRLLASGQLDDNGCFTFRYAEVEPLEVTVSAADGHGKTFTIPREQLEPSRNTLNAYVTLVLQNQPLAAVGCSSYFLTVPFTSSVEASPGILALSPQEPQKPFHVVDSESVWRERLKEALLGISFLLSLAAFLLSWRNGRWLRAIQNTNFPPNSERKD